MYAECMLNKQCCHLADQVLAASSRSIWEFHPLWAVENFNDHVASDVLISGQPYIDAANLGTFASLSRTLLRIRWDGWLKGSTAT